MQAKSLERLQAIKLRKQGYSYSEIQQRIPVSQASLSLWLSNIPLTIVQQKRLANLSLVGQKAGAKARREKKKRQLKILKEEVREELPKLIKGPFFMFGLALYQAEGCKQKPWSPSQAVVFANSDPHLVLLMRQWFRKFCGIDRKRFAYRLHIHTTSDVERARDRWAEILQVNPERIAITLKKHIIRSRHQHENYIGLISLKVYKSTWLNRRIELWGDSVAEKLLV